MKKVVFITGASSGIGEAIARDYHRRGVHLVLAARRTEKIEKLAAELTNESTQSLAVSCDVTKDGDLRTAVQKSIDKFGKIDVIIANAGFSIVGQIEELKVEDCVRQFDTNVYGVLRTFYAGIEELKKTKGSFTIVGSVAGHISLGGGSPYSMSKFAVRALADALYFELKPHGVAVTHIAPGFVRSEIRLKSNEEVLDLSQKDPVPDWLVMDTTKAAQEIVVAVEKRKRERVVTGHGKIIVFLQHHFAWFCRWVITKFAVRARMQAPSTN